MSQAASSGREWRTAGLLVAMVAALAAGYLATATPVTVSVDGRSVAVRTHQLTVGGLLHEMGLSFLPQDTISPEPDAILRQGATVVVRRALQVILEADGRRDSLYTQADILAGLLREAHLTLSPGDALLMDGRPAAETASLRTGAAVEASAGRLAAPMASLAVARPPASDARVAYASSETAPSGVVRVVLRRAVPIQVGEGTAVGSFVTLADTVGEALRQQGIPIYLGDRVSPAPSSPVFPGLQVLIQRARPVTIVADGHSIRTRTQSQRVEQVLAEEGVLLDNKDYSSPEPVALVASGMVVTVTRVREEVITEEESIPYNTVWQAAPEMEIDERQIAQAGRDGVFKRTVHVVFENGKETKRLLEREWVDREPVTKIIAFGTKVVLHQAVTPDGLIQYWRKVRVYATWYNASHGWWAPNSPWYGMTRTGMWATKGIIAVDPQAIRLHTKMYVPGYGFGAAEDTGGLIRGMRIDLAFDEGDPSSHGLGWVTIYLLPPVPPAGEIPFILPDYPREP